MGWELEGGSKERLGVTAWSSSKALDGESEMVSTV